MSTKGTAQNSPLTPFRVRWTLNQGVAYIVGLKLAASLQKAGVKKIRDAYTKGILTSVWRPRKSARRRRKALKPQQIARLRAALGAIGLPTETDAEGIDLFIRCLTRQKADAEGFQRGKAEGHKLGYVEGFARGRKRGRGEGRRREFDIALQIDKDSREFLNLERMAFKVTKLIADGTEYYPLACSLYHEMLGLSTFYGSAEVLIPIRPLAKIVSYTRRTLEALTVKCGVRIGGRTMGAQVTVDFRTGKGKLVVYLPDPNKPDVP